MPLLPLIAGTTTPKKLTDLSAPEKNHWVEQTLLEQLGCMQRGWPVDAGALKQARAFAKGDEALEARIALAEAMIQKGPQMQTGPALGAGKS